MSGNRVNRPFNINNTERFNLMWMILIQKELITVIFNHTAVFLIKNVPEFNIDRGYNTEFLKILRGINRLDILICGYK